MVSIILVAGSLLTNEVYILIQAVNHNECLNVCKIYGTYVTTINLTHMTNQQHVELLDSATKEFS